MSPICILSYLQMCKKLKLLILVSITVLFTYNVVFICICRKEKSVFCIKGVYRLYHYNGYLIIELFSKQMNLSNKVLVFLYKTTKNRIIT